MEVSVENAGGLERRMTVQVPAERIEEEVKSRLESMMRTVKVAGFRPGKVPLKVVEQKYGKQVRLEVIDRLVSTTMQEAFVEHSIRPVGAPSIEPSVPGPGEPLKYVATFEVFPEFEGEIDLGFEVERPQVEIIEADIDNMLDNLRRQRTVWQPAGRAAQTGDQVTIDFSGTINGEPFSGGKAENVPLVLGSGKMIPGFEEQLAGVSAGEEKTLTVTFPDDYPVAELAGKPAEFAVKVSGVDQPVLPVLDDEFAAAFGVADRGLAGLREDVTANMQRELKGIVTSRLKEQVFGGLLANNPLEVPKQLVENELQEIQRHGNVQQAAADELRENATRRVKLGVLVSELARRNNIQLDPDRIRQTIEAIASSYEKPEEVVQWYYSNQELMANVQSAVIEEQVVDWVIEHGNVQLRDRKMSFSELVDEARKSQDKG